MGSDNWREKLEAYLDGELPPAESREFTAQAAADPARQQELAERLRWRHEFRRALGEAPPRTAPKRRDLRRAPWLVAAGLVAAVGITALLRSVSGWQNSRPATIRSGQVVAPRFGEVPDQVVVLQDDHFDLPDGFNR